MNPSGVDLSFHEKRGRFDVERKRRVSGYFLPERDYVKLPWEYLNNNEDLISLLNSGKTMCPRCNCAYVGNGHRVCSHCECYGFIPLVEPYAENIKQRINNRLNVRPQSQMQQPDPWYKQRGRFWVKHEDPVWENMWKKEADEAVKSLRRFSRKRKAMRSKRSKRRSKRRKRRFGSANACSEVKKCSICGENKKTIYVNMGKFHMCLCRKCRKNLE